MVFFREKIANLQPRSKGFYRGSVGFRRLRVGLLSAVRHLRFRSPPKLCDSIVDAGWKIQSDYPPGKYTSRPKVVDNIFSFSKGGIW